MEKKIRFSQNIKWKVLYFTSKIAIRAGFSRSTLMQRLAERQGRTALHYAARFGDSEIYELLINSGADPLILDNTGVSPREAITKVFSSNLDVR